MQTQKFDECISYFNRKVSSMDIDQKHKIELLGMITAIGLAPEKEMPHWTSCDDSNPNIDMSFPHSDVYLVTYDSGEMDVARWSNVNPFWTDHVTEPRWWGVQFANVIAWMPLPKPFKE